MGGSPLWLTGWWLLPCGLALANTAWAFVAWRKQARGDLLLAVLLAILGWAATGVAAGGWSLGVEPWVGWAQPLWQSPPVVAFIVWSAVIVFLWRVAWWTRPQVGWTLVNIIFYTGVFTGAAPRWVAALTDSETFAVTAMLGVSLFFVWYGLKQAAENDRRRALGQAPIEVELSDKVPTWPNLVYIELICILVVLTIILLWALAFPAPLEAPADPAVTPNPAKAPWYFVGIQELLVYFDPSIAGVVLPTLALVALVLLPYLDRNPRGNGYYTFRERRWAISLFVFGFVGVWWFLIVIGVFFRGPGWTFGTSLSPAEVTPPGTSEFVPPPSRPLSEYVWNVPIGTAVSDRPAAKPKAATMPAFVRELPGIVVLLLYFWVLPLWLSRGPLRPVRQSLGGVRYWTAALLLLALGTIPLKMLVHFVFRVSYLVALPELDLYF